LVVAEFLKKKITQVVYIYLDKVNRMLKRRLEPQLEEMEEMRRPERPAVAAE